MGALMTSPEGIAEWVAEFRSQSNGPFQLNRWIPQPIPARDPAGEKRIRDFLSKWGPPVPAEIGDVRFPDFEQQCEAFLAAEPHVVSSIMGLFPEAFVSQLKDRRISWFACVTTLSEAREAELAGADAVVAQGHEAGGIVVLSTKLRPSVKVSVSWLYFLAFQTNSQFLSSRPGALGMVAGSPPH
jgi:nitronate monooxygenase